MSKKKAKNDTPKQTDWKEKAMSRVKETKALNKRIREITLSRDQWKSKYFIAKSNSEIWENELAKIKKKLNEILTE